MRKQSMRILKVKFVKLYVKYEHKKEDTNI